MTTSLLDSRVSRLEKNLAHFGDELKLALHYVRNDAGSSLTKSRLVLEQLLIRIYVIEMDHEPRKPMLGDMLNDNQFTRKIERRIVSRMNSIRDLGNLGPHGERVEASDAARVLEDLCDVIDWYLRSYAGRQLIEAELAETTHGVPKPHIRGVTPVQRAPQRPAQRPAARPASFSFDAPLGWLLMSMAALWAVGCVGAMFLDDPSERINAFQALMAFVVVSVPMGLLGLYLAARRLF